LLPKLSKSILDAFWWRYDPGKMAPMPRLRARRDRRRCSGHWEWQLQFPRLRAPQLANFGFLESGTCICTGPTSPGNSKPLQCLAGMDLPLGNACSQAADHRYPSLGRKITAISSPLNCEPPDAFRRSKIAGGYNHAFLYDPTCREYAIYDGMGRFRQVTKELSCGRGRFAGAGTCATKPLARAGAKLRSRPCSGSR
jgi:hypothetical protein